LNYKGITSIQIAKISDSKMLRNTPVSPVNKADAESDARFSFLRQYSFYSAVCSIENKNTLRKASKRNENPKHIVINNKHCSKK
jgi:hypothetical protein